MSSTFSGKGGTPTSMVVCGNALDILTAWPEDYFDCVVTSPPYW